MKRDAKIPKFLQSILCSYNLNEIDLEKDKVAIITYVLNYGSWKEIKWLYSVFPEKEIKKVVKYPGRGLWFEKVLNFWESVLGIRLPKKIKQKAILHILP